MPLFYFGFAHPHVPLSLRERLRCDDETATAISARSAFLSDERLILATCERFEIYGCSGDLARNDWLQLLAQTFEIKEAELHDQCRLLTREAVAKQILRVAAGLESRIIGEPQILNQVRRALGRGQAIGAVGPVLSALVRAAIHAGKRVRCETPINVAARSSATLAVDRVRQNLENFGKVSVLILGTGRLAQDVAAALIHARAGQWWFVSRQAERAVALATKLGGGGFGMEELAPAIAHADALIACSQSPRFLVTPGMIPFERGRPLSIIDLGMPRNVDPAVAVHSMVRLTGLDAMVCDEVQRDLGVVLAERIIDEELDRFNAWHCHRGAAPRIAELVRMAESQVSDDRAARKRLHERILGLKRAVAA